MLSRPVGRCPGRFGRSELWNRGVGTSEQVPRSTSRVPTSDMASSPVAEAVMNGERILVTGGSGFIGTNLVSRLLHDGAQVLNLDVAPPRDPSHLRYWRPTDVLDRQDLNTDVARFSPTLAVHLAARTDLDGTTIHDYRANTTGVRNVVEVFAAADPPPRRVIFASTRMVCAIGQVPTRDDEYSPSNAYGLSKVVGESMVREAAAPFEWTIVRPTSIWGEWFAIPYRGFFDAVRHGRYVHPKGRDVLKSFGYVGNTVYQLTCLLQASPSDVDHAMFYIADYEPVSVCDMAERIRTGFDAPRIRTVPTGALLGVGRVGDVLKRVGWTDPPLTTFRVNNLITPMAFDVGALEAVVGTLPYSLDEGIDRTVAWMRSHPRSTSA